MCDITSVIQLASLFLSSSISFFLTLSRRQLLFKLQCVELICFIYEKSTLLYHQFTSLSDAVKYVLLLHQTNCYSPMDQTRVAYIRFLFIPSQ